MVISVSKTTSTVNLDTDSNGNTGVLRDGSGNAEGNTLTANTNLVTLGTFTGSVATITSATTLGANTDIIADATGGTFALTMPSAVAGLTYHIFKKDNVAAVTLTGVTGVSTLTTGMQNTWHRIVCDGTNFYCG
jgi:hypothetical protein